MHGLLKDARPELPLPGVTPAGGARQRRAEIWAVGGGKGGIGKSFVSSSLGLLLAARGRSVTMVDADLGGANLHTLLGVSPPTATLSDFFNRKGELNTLVVETGVPNLRLIGGAGDTLEAANPRFRQKVKLLTRLRETAGDVLLLDLGAGSSFTTLDFFNLAHTPIVVVLPEPTSVENGYRFIRAAVVRRLRMVSKHFAFHKLLDEVQDPRNDATLRHVDAILERARRLDAEIGDHATRAIQQFTPRLVLNQVREPEDMKVGYGLRNACQKLLGINLRFQGALPHDDQVWRAIRKRKPFVLQFPDAPTTAALRGLIDRLHDGAQLVMDF